MEESSCVCSTLGVSKECRSDGKKLFLGTLVLWSHLCCTGVGVEFDACWTCLNPQAPLLHCKQP